jgi:hypothetical protein
MLDGSHRSLVRPRLEARLKQEPASPSSGRAD